MIFLMILLGIPRTTFIVKCIVSLVKFRPIIDGNSIAMRESFRL